MTSSILLRDVAVRLGTTEALAIDALEIQPGERVGVRGLNGSGKSTLLRLLAGLIEPTRGTISGRPPRGRAVLVHQQPYLFRGSALDNVTYALALQGKPVASATSWLQQFGAASLAQRSAKELSGGERRRVALARALAVEPELLLLDEPFVGLDDAGLVHATQALQQFTGTLVIASPELADGTALATLVERVVSLEPVATR